MFTRLSLTLLIAMSATPALARASVQVPEPGDAALFVVAVVGLVVGRYTSRRRPRGDE